MNDDDSSVQILLLALQISRTKLQQFKEKNKNRTNTKMQRQPKRVCSLLTLSNFTASFTSTDSSFGCTTASLFSTSAVAKTRNSPVPPP
jgi:hypothetical protein